MYVCVHVYVEVSFIYTYALSMYAMLASDSAYFKTVITYDDACAGRWVGLSLRETT